METEMERLLSEINNNKDKIWTTKEELTDVIKTVENINGEIIYPKVITQVLNDDFIPSYSLQGDDKWTTCKKLPEGEIKKI